MAPKLRDLHVLWKIWSPELMVAGLSDENVHPGAKKAFVELGWWDRAKKYPADDLSELVVPEISGPHAGRARSPSDARAVRTGSLWIKSRCDAGKRRTASSTASRSSWAC